MLCKVLYCMRVPRLLAEIVPENILLKLDASGNKSIVFLGEKRLDTAPFMTYFVSNFYQKVNIASRQTGSPHNSHPSLPELFAIESKFLLTMQLVDYKEIRLIRKQEMQNKA